MIKKITSNEFENEIKEGVSFVDFFANWCGPCKMLSPIVEELSNEVNDVKFLKVDVDESADVAASFGIMSIPTLLMFKDGNLVSKHTGFLSKSELEEFVNKNK